MSALLPLALTQDGLSQVRTPDQTLLEWPSLGSKEVAYLNNNTITVHSARVIVVLQLGSNQIRVVEGGEEGSILILQAANLTAVDNIGNLRLAGNFGLSNSADTLVLIRDGNNWLELSRSNNQ